VVEKELPTPKYAVFFAYAYLFIYYTRLQDNIPGLGAIPWVGVLFLLVSLWGLLQLLTSKRNFFKMPIALIFWLGILFGISGIGAVSVIAYKMSIAWILELFMQCIVLVIVFSSVERFKKLHHFWVVIYCVMAIFTLKNAPSGPGDFTLDANDACLALGMGIPFAFYALYQKNLSNKRRIFYYVVLVLLFAGIIATSSRGGFLGMIAGLLTIWWMGRSRLKVAMFGLLGALVAGGVFLSFVPQNYIEDMQSISDTENSTRIERFRTWEIGWEMFKANPILGVGVGNFSNTVHLYQHKTSWWTGNEKSLSCRSAHSLYFQIIPELGIVGTSVYFFVMCVLPLRLLRLLKKLNLSDPNQLQIKLFSQALIASMAVYAIAGIFISVAYYPHIPIWLVMYTITIHVLKDTCGKAFLEREKNNSRTKYHSKVGA
jgi:O-antigen ligase